MLSILRISRERPSSGRCRFDGPPCAGDGSAVPGANWALRRWVFSNCASKARFRLFRARADPMLKICNWKSAQERTMHFCQGLERRYAWTRAGKKSVPTLQATRFHSLICADAVLTRSNVSQSVLCGADAHRWGCSSESWSSGGQAPRGGSPCCPGYEGGRQRVGICGRRNVRWNDEISRRPWCTSFARSRFPCLPPADPLGIHSAHSPRSGVPPRQRHGA